MYRRWLSFRHEVVKHRLFVIILSLSVAACCLAKCDSVCAKLRSQELDNVSIAMRTSPGRCDPSSQTARQSETDISCDIARPQHVHEMLALRGHVKKYDRRGPVSLVSKRTTTSGGERRSMAIREILFDEQQTSRARALLGRRPCFQQLRASYSTAASSGGASESAPQATSA